MRLLHLIPRNALRHKLRTTLTAVGLALAIIAFVVLRAFVGAFYAAVDAAAPDRLITRNADSLMFALPLAYRDKITQLPGVKDISWSNWFGGIYIDERNFFAQFAADLESFLRLCPEYRVDDPEQLRAALTERNAAVVGRKLASRFGWKLGDTVRIRGTIFPGDFDFVVRAIYTGRDANTDETMFLFHWQYLYERARAADPAARADVGWYVVQIDDSSRTAEMSQAIDATFANSSAESLTETEKAFQLGFAQMSGAIVNGMKIVSVLIVSVVLLILVNTMAMAARERVKEYAVLKTLGFSGFDLVVLIAGESMLIAIAGGALGVAVVMPLVRGLSQSLSAWFPVFRVETATLVACAAISLVVGVAAAVVPSVRASTVRAADGLRRIG